MITRLQLGWAAVLLASVVPLHAAVDTADDVVRVHIEAIGGMARIKSLASLRAAGHVTAGGKRLGFTMFAERPDKIRVETEENGRTLVQASNGREPAWEFDAGQWPPRYKDMPAAAAKVFTADSDFDDPLVAGASRGYTIDYAGKVAEGGREYIRLLVTRNLVKTFSLLLDPSTCFILARIDEKEGPYGTRRIVTRYGDFRPVGGVLLPHRVEVVAGGRIVQETDIESTEANPRVSDDLFTRPRRPK